MKKVIIHLYGEKSNWQSSYSKCGIKLDGVGKQGKTIPGTDIQNNVTCKKCKQYH